MAGRKWTEDEIEMVRSNFGKLDTKEIANRLNRTVRAVTHVYEQLGLVKEGVKIGDKFGELEVIGEPYFVKVGQQQKSKVRVRCTCGTEKEILVTTIRQRQDDTLSCGCIKRAKASQRMSEYNQQFFHGLTNTRLYSIWSGMKTRCYNSRQESFKDYGGRGIVVCEEWIDNFRSFYDWAIKNGYLDNLTLERIDNNGNYEPNNCCWVTRKEQSNNKRNNCNITLAAFGETKHIKNWLEDPRCKVASVATLCYRLGAGWKPEVAIETPSRRFK